MKKTELTRRDLEQIVGGACFLASAGGGTYASGMHLASRFEDKAYYPQSVVPLVEVEDVEDEKLGVMVAYIGSPESMEEIYYPVEIVQAVRQLEKQKGRISYILPAEIGAISSLAACTTAAKLGIAVVDGDGAGRAVPELSMTTFSLYRKDVNPVFLASKEENAYVCLSIADGTSETAASEVESFVRPTLAVPCFGQKAGLAMWVLKGSEIKEVIRSRNTLQGCLELGKYIRERKKEELFEKVRKMGYGKPRSLVGTGASIQTSVGGGFDKGTLTFTTGGDVEENNITVLFQNESLIAWDARRPQPLATAPDLISYLVEFAEEDQTGEEYTRWTYSNGDLQGLDPEKLKRATFELVLIGATPSMYALEEGLQNRCKEVCKQNHFPKEALNKGIFNKGVSDSGSRPSSSILKSFARVLNELGYYGTIGESDRQGDEDPAE